MPGVWDTIQQARADVTASTRIPMDIVNRMFPDTIFVVNGDPLRTRFHPQAPGVPRCTRMRALAHLEHTDIRDLWCSSH